MFVKMKRMGVFLLIGVMILFCQSTEIFGNTLMREKLRSIWQDTWIKAGPLRINAVLFLNNVGYDSNVYRTTIDPINDFTLTAGPGLTVYLPIEQRVLFSVSGSPQYDFFKDTEKERSWSTYFGGKVHFFIGRFFFILGIDYSDAKQRWDSEIDLRLRRKEDSLHGAVLWQTSRRTSISLGYKKVKYDYESIEYETYNFRERLNREENYLKIFGFYQRSSRLKYFVNVEYGIFNFENPLNLNDSRSLGFYGGIEYFPFGRIRGKLQLGYKSFDSINSEKQDYRGIVGDMNVSVRLAKPLAVRAVYKRDTSFSLYHDSTYFLENRYGGGVSVYLLKKFRVDYDYGLGKNSYPQNQIMPDSSQERSWQETDITMEGRRDDYVIHSVGMYFKIKDTIGIGVIASRWVRESNVWFGERARDFLGFNLTYDF